MKYSRYILLFSGILATILSSVISALPIWIANQGEVSAMFPTLFVPATFTFSIWGVIYVSWIILGIFVALWKVKVSTKNASLLWVAQVFSSFWLIPSQFLYTATSLIVMIWLVFLLLLGFFISMKEDTYFRYTLELFLGWIIVASIANLHLVLVDYTLYLYPITFTLISIIIATGVFAGWILKYKAFTASFVFLWASFGIIAGQENNMVQIFTGIGFLIIFELLFWVNKDFIESKINTLRKGKK